MNPLGVSFSQIQVSDLLLVDADGDVVEGRLRVNQAAFAIHSQVHRARPDVISAAHAHSIHGKSWSAFGELLEPLTQDSSRSSSHAVFDDYAGVVLDVEEGRRIAGALGPHKAVILRNHGLLTAGQSVDEAVWWFITMERTCQSQLLIEATGRTPVRIDEVQARRTAKLLGSPLSGWFSFQPLWDRITAEQPDLFD